jgi:hypothetical protein
LDVVCPQAAINNQNRTRSLLTLADPQHFAFFLRPRSRAFRQPIYPAIGGHVLAPMSALAIVTLSVFSAVKADEMLKRRQEEIGKASDSLVKAAPTSAAVLCRSGPGRGTSGIIARSQLIGRDNSHGKIAVSPEAKAMR